MDWPLTLSCFVLWSALTGLDARRARAASAGPPVSVVTNVAECASLETEALSALLRVELGKRYVDGHDDAIRVEIGCSAAAVDIVAYYGQGRFRGRKLPLREVSGEVGARILALAIAELVRGDHPEPRDAAMERAPQPSLEPVPTAGRRQVRLLLQGHTEAFRLNEPTLWGAALAAEYIRVKPWRLQLSVGFSRASQRFDLGNVDSTLATFGLHAGAGWALSPVELRGMLGYRLGLARIAGDATSDSVRPVQSGSTQGFFGGPSADLAIVYRVSPLLALVGLEAGLVVSPVEGLVAEANNVRLAGYWLRLYAGLGFEL